MKVLKFGGGCLRDAAGLDRAAEIIRRDPERRVVVVSAVSGVTDLLLEACRRAEKNEDHIAPALRRLREAHLSIAGPLLGAGTPRSDWERSLDLSAKKVERLLYGISFTGEATPFTRAHLLSYGERLSAFLLAAVLRDRGVEACALESDRIGMITDDVAENATVDLAAFGPNLARTLAGLGPGRPVPVITGFFGVTPRGRVATFGRNGTDYSAAVVARALRATRLEIWKDVEGFMSADPKLIPGARRIGRLSFSEAAELAYFGARILHPRTLEPLRGLRISVVIRHTGCPESPGTEVSVDGSVEAEVIKSVTSNPDVALLRIYGPGVGFKPGIIGRIGGKLSGLGINIHSVLTSQTCINLLLDRKDAAGGLAALAEDRGGVIERVELEDDIALIAAVGEGLRSRRGLAARIFASVSRAGVNVEMACAGASAVASYFIVKRADASKAVHALHREFFPKRPRRAAGSPRLRGGLKSRRA